MQKLLLFFLWISRLCLLNTPQPKFKALFLRRRLFILTAIFRFNGPPLLHQKGYSDVIHSKALECSVCESALSGMQHGCFELSDSQTRVLHN